MENRDFPTPLAIVAVAVAGILAWTYPVRHRCPAGSGYAARFVGPGETLAGSPAGEATVGTTELARFWYGRKVDDPARYFSAWVNWGDPRHQDRRDDRRGFWAHVRLDADHSVGGRWCYLVENRRQGTGEKIAEPFYCGAGGYVAYVKVWDGARTPLKPSIRLRP